MSCKVDITNPDDPLNQRFRVHFSHQDSTFLSFLKALDKPLLKYLKSELIQHFCAIAITEPAETGASNARFGILTGDPDTDLARLIPSMTVRQFLTMCIDRPSTFIEFDLLQFPVTGNAHGLLQQIDWVTEMNMLVSIRLRFTKLAWYRSYRQFAQSRGIALSASFDRFGVLRPRLVTVGFEDFVNNVMPDANGSTKISINQVILAGFRYDYMTRHEQTYLYSDDNDAYLFLLPGCISIHQYIAESNQLRDPTTSKRSHSPAALPAPAFDLCHQEGQWPHPSEPTPEPPNVLTDHMRTPSIAGQSQQASIHHHQQSQAWQNAVVKYIPTTHQQIQHGPSAFANHHSPWVGGPAQRGGWPGRRRPSEAALSENQPTDSTLIHASEFKFNHRSLDKVILTQMFLAATAKSQGENHPHLAGSYLDSKSPPTTNRYTQYQKRHSKSPIEPETAGFSQQQQQAISHEASQAPSFWERQAASSPETAKTRDIQPKNNVHVRQCYDIISPQSQYQDLGQNQLPSPIPAITNPHPPPGSTNRIRSYSIPRSTEQSIAQHTATSDSALQHGNTSMSRIKKETCSKPTSPPSGAMDVDETEVAKKSNIGIKKQRLLTGGSSPQQPVHLDEDGDGDEDEDDAAEDGQGRESKKRKKFKRHVGKRR
ncbi:MAG: hypothetical protein Q9192_000983 [Flavoplaca navasiana]